MVLITKKSILDITILIAVASYASSMAPTTFPDSLLNFANYIFIMSLYIQNYSKIDFYYLPD